MDDLTTVLQVGEGYHIEFKQSLDKSFVEEACAFANSGGGRIFLGVADDGTIKGVDTGNVMRSRVQDTLGQIEPKLNCTIKAEGNVLIVHVPEGTEKPYGCSRGLFMRMGANSQKLTRNQIIEFFQKEGRIRWDELHHTKACYPDDFDPEAFSRFLKLAGISCTIDREALLRNLDCLSDDNQLTNAGVLFFARDIDFLLNHAIVVCALYKGTEKVHVL
ncbi:MAG TPA: RNA-binding domain-containing protein, partial [Oceanipulchritudo sp.]|nr:RNA-binding domain-containing protein [Oceanipulchritudo sp.]